MLNWTSELQDAHREAHGQESAVKTSGSSTSAAIKGTPVLDYISDEVVSPVLRRDSVVVSETSGSGVAA